MVPLNVKAPMQRGSMQKLPLPRQLVACHPLVKSRGVDLQ